MKKKSFFSEFFQIRTCCVHTGQRPEKNSLWKATSVHEAMTSSSRFQKSVGRSKLTSEQADWPGAADISEFEKINDVDQLWCHEPVMCFLFPGGGWGWQQEDRLSSGPQTVSYNTSVINQVIDRLTGSWSLVPIDPTLLAYVFQHREWRQTPETLEEMQLQRESQTGETLLIHQLISDWLRSGGRCLRVYPSVSTEMNVWSPAGLLCRKHQRWISWWRWDASTGNDSPAPWLFNTESQLTESWFMVLRWCFVVECWLIEEELVK